MFDNDNGCTAVNQPLEYVQQRSYIKRVQPDGWFVEDENGVALAFAHFTGQFQPLCFAARKAWCFFAERKVAEPQIF